MKQEIESLKERNKRVEADKAWETSMMRRTIVAVMTYFTIVLLLYLINAPNPWITALVPTLGFVLSTLSLSFVKKWWIANVYKKV